MSIRSRLYIGFLTLIGLFIIEFFVIQQLSRDVMKNTLYLNNSQAVIRNSNLLYQSMIGMQSAQRGFLLTGQKNFLDPYYKGLVDIPPLLNEQRSLLTAQIQKSRLDSIEQLHSEWIKNANEMIGARLDTTIDFDQSFIKILDVNAGPLVGTKLLEKSRLLFISFDAHEYDLRYKRREVLQKSIATARTITIALTVSSILISLITGFIIIRIITKRIARMENLAVSISQGDFTQINVKEQDELQALCQSLNLMSSTLSKSFKDFEQKNRELDQFAYIVSHDLKAPLRGIINLIDWMDEDHATEITVDVKKKLDLIKGRAIRLENLINGLLEYARVGKVKSNFQKVDVAVLIREISELVVPKNFNLHLADNLPQFVTEKIRLEQVFTNLLSNAVKYHHADIGNIWINVDNTENFYEFTVKDDGPGIAPQYHEKIFQIFQTLMERDALESTGVGLAIVKKVVEDLNGRIWINSSVGNGSSFSFTWPKSTS